MPADQPGKIALATTFGLILSDDAGATWQWTCERAAATSMANLYAVGPPAIASGGVGDRFYALSPIEGLAISDDGSCSWRTAAGFGAGTTPSDFFVDPSNPARVVAVAAQQVDGGGSSSSIFVSNDGGATFAGAPIYTAPPGAAIVGVEIARSNPSVIYLSFYTTTASARDPVLARSTDGGAHWTATDLTAALGPNMVRILAVDPQNSDLVYLRVIAAAGDALAITRDGGGTFAMPATFTNGQVSAFARLQSGTVLVGALIATAGGGTEGTALRSNDGGASFQAWSTLPNPTHLVGLAERVEGGQPRLYLSGKNYSDGWALAVSADEGMTLTPLMTYDQVKGIKSCVQEVCLDTCKFENMQAVWDLSVCTGAAGAGGGPSGGGSGCGCGVDPTRPAGGAAFLACVAAVALRRRRGARGAKRAPNRFVDGDRLDSPPRAV